MDSKEAERLRAAKRASAGRLGRLDIGRWHLERIDPRLHAYVAEVSGNPEGHNLWELLAVERFLRLCRRYGLSRTHVRAFYDFYESLYFPGRSGHTRYRLTPVQCFQFASIYGFRENGVRVTRTAVLYVPRKFSKTTQTAAVALFDLLYGEANGESYTGANSQDQAKKCFEVIRGAMQRLDPKEKYYTINEQIIKSRRKDRSAIAQCLTANARTKDGLNASTVIMDEYSQSRDSRLLDVLTTSMGARREPLTVIITTASDAFDGPFYQMLDGCKRVLMGELENDALFAHLFEPDVDDREDDPATWRKVHPHLGVTVSEDFYRQEYASAQVGGSAAMMAFRTKLLNVYTTDSRKSWITAEAAAKIMRPFSVENLRGAPAATVAIDLSVRGDLSCASTCIHFAETQSFLIDTHYFFPRGALPGHPNEALFRTWAAGGWLHLLDGDVIDYRAIAQFVLERPKYVRLFAVGYDPYKSREMRNILSNSGLKTLLKPVRQTYGEFTSACMSLETGIYTGKIMMNDNPINLYCLENAVLDTDRLGNMKPVKRQETRRIDGLITALMSLKLFHELRRLR